MITFNNIQVFALNARFERTGNSNVTVVFPGQVDVGSIATLSFDGVKKRFVVVSIIPDIDSTTALCVGSNRITDVVAAKSWGTTTFNTIINEILSDHDLVIDTINSDSSFLSQVVNKWQTINGQMLGSTLTRMTNYIPGMTWRINDNGQILFIADEYSNTTDKTSVTQLISDDRIIVSLSTDNLPEYMLPGNAVTVDFLGKQSTINVETTLYTYSTEEETVELLANTNRHVVERLVDDRIKASLSKPWSAQIIQYNAADNTIDIEPDDPEIKGLGIKKCKLYFGFPGSVINPSGPCLFSFINGDPQQPFVYAFGSDQVETLNLATGDDFAALYTATQSNFDAIESYLSTVVHNHPLGPTTGPATPPPSMEDVSSTIVKIT